jgi:ATP-dependent helicase/nuclease subunit A
MAERIRRSSFVRRETAFVVGLTPAEVYLAEPDQSETILVHGIIDCFFEENGHMVLLDYKSDYVTEDGIEALKQRYAVQMEIYKKAVERSTGVPVGECALYLFALDRAVRYSGIDYSGIMI